MKLYYWGDVETLADYGNGYAFAIANSKDEAIELICKEVFSDNAIKLMEELLNTEPEVHENPVGFTIRGSA